MLEAYEAGVDECVLKPIHPLLFEAKIKAWLRRACGYARSAQGWKFPSDPFGSGLGAWQKQPIHLTNLELRLLYYLMGRPGRTVSTEELCRRVWGHGAGGDVATLKNLVYRLRHKIEAEPAHLHYVHTVVSVGYQFIAN